MKREVNFNALSHRQVLEYYVENPGEIEQGLHNIIMELWVFKGRVDLVARDKKEKVCLIEVIHRSHYDRQFWIGKLRRYRASLREMGRAIFKVDNIEFRLLLKKTGRPVEDVSGSVSSQHSGETAKNSRSVQRVPGQDLGCGRVRCGEYPSSQTPNLDFQT